jgi:hypothetical protein
MKNCTRVWRNIYNLPGVRSTSGIINILPNTSAIFHQYFENKCNFLLMSHYSHFTIQNINILLNFPRAQKRAN